MATNNRRDTKKLTIKEAKRFYTGALDDLVSIDTALSGAAFLGLSLANPSEQSLENRRFCVADSREIGKQLVVNEVAAFACFLLSILVAKALKLHILMCTEEQFMVLRNQIIRGSLLVLSSLGLVMGCIFMALAMIGVIQIKIGKLACGSYYGWRAAGTLTALFTLALLIYIPLMFRVLINTVENVANPSEPAPSEPAPPEA